MGRNGAGKGVAGAEAVGDANALVPSLDFMVVQLLEATKVLEVLVLIVVVVEVDVAHLEDAARELAPGTLPLCVASLSTSPPPTFARADVQAAMLAGDGPADLPRARLGGFGLDGLGGVLGLFGEVKQMGALHAVPVAIGDLVEADAVGVVGGIAAIAEQQYIFSLGGIADGAGICLFVFLFGIFAQPLLDVEFGHLLLVLNGVGGYSGA